MRTLFQILLVALILASCKDNKIERPQKPDNLIPEDKMVDILYDMTLMSSAKGVSRKILENKGISPEDYVYNKHGIDSIQFVESNDYYAFDIEGYEVLYDQVKSRLETDKEGFQAILDEEKKHRDSLTRANKKRDSLQRLKRRQQRDSVAKKTNPNRLNRDDKSSQ